jgi:hypothetical protein
VASSQNFTQDKVEWAQYAVKKQKAEGSGAGGGARKAIADRCRSCNDHFEEHLVSTFEWEEYCEKLHTVPGFAEEAIQGKAVAAGELKRSWIPSEAGFDLSVDVLVQSHGLFLTRSEFIDFCGKAPEDCKVSPIMGFNTSGELCKGYPAKDPSKPYRTFTAQCRSSDYTRATSLIAKQDVFKSMSSLHLAKLKRDRAKSKTMPKSILNHKMYTKEELLLRAESFEMAGGEGRKEGSGSEAEDDPDESEYELEWAGVQPKPATSTTPVKGKGGDAAASSASVWNQSGKKSGAASSVHELEESDEGGDEGRAKGATHWMQAVNLTKILSGGKLGRKEGFANGCVERLVNPKTQICCKHRISAVSLLHVCVRPLPYHIATCVSCSPVAHDMSRL